jgi:PTS system nitrogen regulatory IIA component
MADHDILTIEEVAEYLRVSERTIYDWANKGQLPCGKLGTTWRFKRTEIERWVDNRLSHKTETPSPEAVAVSDVLVPERIIIFDETAKVPALERLMDCLAQAPEVKKRDELSREIYQREELMSTGIGFNVAVPHVRLASVTELVMAMGVSSSDITDYGSLDENPVRIIFMVAARVDQHAQYLKTLGAVSSHLKSRDLREAIMAASEPEAIYKLLTE